MNRGFGGEVQDLTRSKVQWMEAKEGDYLMRFELGFGGFVCGDGWCVEV